jgi:DNA polymerase I-like protein with 3'-5' exonuclease and polymerase domains
MTKTLYSLDIETRALNQSGPNTFALEPFRVRQGSAEISSVAVCRPDNSVIQIVNDKAQHLWEREVRDLLRSLKGKRVFAHFTMFDVAWLIATLERRKFRPIPKEITDVVWADTALLTKWLINSQLAEDSRFSYSLANLAETFLPDHPSIKDFLEMKKQPFVAGENSEYWESRGQLDVVMTKALAEKLMPLVPESMRTGLMTEWSCIVPVANSWCNGIQIDESKIDEVEARLVAKMNESTNFLGLEGSVINSPKQLGNLLFGEWGLTPWSYTPTKTPSTAGDDLMWIQYELKGSSPGMADKLEYVLSYKSNKTLKSKYVDTLKTALSYTGDGYIYGGPKLFGTYTSRMTYSNTTVKDGPKVSIALHQLPRVKGKNAESIRAIRSLLVAPEGFGVVEVDASGQESRLMAIRSNDSVMLEIFKRRLNFHSMTGAAIIGMDYNEFMKRYKENDMYIIEQRQLGKLTNLSCNYRIGGPALASKAFTEYDTYMTAETGRFLVNTFSRQYEGVPKYWGNVIRSAKELGYTECYGGKRYKLSKWDEKNRWMTESSAINFPIQGAGASMKEIAISVTAKEFPEVIFALDLHDATFSYAPLDGLQETAEDLIGVLENIDYASFWGFEPPIPLPYESTIGANFGEVK